MFANEAPRSRHRQVGSTQAPQRFDRNDLALLCQHAEFVLPAMLRGEREPALTLFG